MSSPQRKLALLLAGSGLSLPEIERAISELQHEGPYELLMQVDYIRKEISTVFGRRRHEPIWDYKPIPSVQIRESLGGLSDIGVRVESLLKDQARLGTHEAYKLLSTSLVSANALHRRDVPPLSRKALSNWVARLSKIVPGKLILSHATQIRNSLVHSPDADWRLGPEESQ